MTEQTDMRRSAYCTGGDLDGQAWWITVQPGEIQVISGRRYRLCGDVFRPALKDAE